MDNEDKYYDLEYIHLVKDIINNEEFEKTKNIVHHGLNRFDHSLRVSYYSYKVARLLRLAYKDVARAGLLHDFFFVNNSNIDTTKRIDVLMNHPKYALNNSKRHFELSDREKDIITTHMFPIYPKVPKYLESWLVDIVDDVVAVWEALHMGRKHIGVAVNFLMVVMLNYWR